MSNVAIILTGHFREYKEVFDSFDKYILQDLQPDVFIHTWKNLGLNTGRYQFDTVEDLDVVDVMDKYKPAAICVEDPEAIEIGIRDFVADHTVPVENIVNMFRKTYLGGRMMHQAEKEYDLVIKARPDIMFEEKIPRDPNHKIQGIHVPNANNLQVCDHLAFGNQFGMNYYCNLYRQIGSYYQAGLTVPNSNPGGSPLHAESMLYKHLLYADGPYIHHTPWKYHIPHKRRGM